MPPKAGTRRAQPVTHGLGKHFESPQRPRDKQKTQVVVHVPGKASKRRHALARLAQLQSTSTGSSQDHELSCMGDSADYSDGVEDSLWESEAIDPMDEEYIPSNDDHYMEQDEQHVGKPQQQANESQPTTSNRRVHPDQPAEHLYNSWKSLVPTLVAPYLHYASRTLGKPLPPILPTLSLCNLVICIQKPTKILCLLFDRKLEIISGIESDSLQISSPWRFWAAIAQRSPKSSSISACSPLHLLSPVWLCQWTYSHSTSHSLSGRVMP